MPSKTTQQQGQADPFKTQIGKWVKAMESSRDLAHLNQIKDEWIDVVPENHSRRGELTGTYLCWRGVHRHGLFWPLVTTDQRLAEAAEFHRQEQARKGRKGAA